jgi:hypothetical protein
LYFFVFPVSGLTSLLVFLTYVLLSGFFPWLFLLRVVEGGSVMTAFDILKFFLSHDHFFYFVPCHFTFLHYYLIYGFSFSSHQPKYVFSSSHKYRSIARNIIFPFEGVFFFLFSLYPKIHG